MKVLIINASPIRRGLVSRMLERAVELCLARGCSCESVSLQHAHIAYCTGCCRCRTTGECVLPHDDAHDIAQKIVRADLLIVGTPTYWGNMSAPLKTLFDRIVYALAELPPRSFPKPKLRGKKAVIVTACSTPYPFNILMHQSRGAVRAVNEVLHTAGFTTSAIEIAGSFGKSAVPDKYFDKLKKRIDKWTTV